jgi:hypothetical protein
MEAFDNSFDDYNLLAHLAHDTMKLIYEEAFNTVKRKVLDILKLLNIKEPYNDKFLIRFRLLFQEYFSLVFTCGKENIDTVRDKLRRVVGEYTIPVQKVESDIESKGFENLVSFSFSLCIFMVLHDPILVFNIVSFDKRVLMYHYYSKSDFVNIDGFAKELTPCIVILPPPMLRANNVYQGIKPAVYLIANTSETIKSECEKNSNLNKGRSHSTSEIMNIQSAILTEGIKVEDEHPKSNYYNNVEKNRENSNSESNLNSILSHITTAIVKQANSNEPSPITITQKENIAENMVNDKDEFNCKKYYDQPLSLSRTILKKGITEKPLSDMNNYKSNIKNYTVSHSRGSSLYDNYSNEVAGSNRTNENNFNKPMIPKAEDHRMLTGGFNMPEIDKLNNSKSFHQNKKVKEAKTDDRSLLEKNDKDIDTDREKRNYPFNKTNTAKYTNINYKSPLITSILNKNEYNTSIMRKKGKYKLI